MLLQGKEGESQGCDNLARTKVVHDTWFARDVNRTCHVYREDQDAYLSTDEELPRAGPILGILRAV